jgi:hypothetical protein
MEEQEKNIRWFVFMRPICNPASPDNEVGVAV